MDKTLQSKALRIDPNISLTSEIVSVDPNTSLTIEQVVHVARFLAKVELTTEAIEKISTSRKYLEAKIKDGQVMYGINTGFGALASVSINSEELSHLQKNIIRSHAAGVGSYLNQETTRAMMFLLVCSLSRGFSGVSVELVNVLVNFLNFNITPCVPEKGSLGASGDLAMLSHIALCLLGEGEAMYEGKIVSAEVAIAEAGIERLTPKAKEGLALINGTHLMAAIGTLLAYDTKRLLKHADIAAALSGDVMNSTISHTNPLLHEVRPHQGQKNSAANIRRLLVGSELLKSHEECNKVQDAYSIRCAPQVHGASYDTLRHFEKIMEIEINSVTDNPLIFSQDNVVLSGGNFHGQPIALAADFLGIAIAEIANISERRVARLVDNSLSGGLPHFLVAKSGLNSGLMIAQYTAAALVSENKVLAHPASVDSITSSANQEDHVSMGAHAMRKCRTILDNLFHVLGIELLCGAQALDFKRPLKTSKVLEIAYSVIRNRVPFIDQDRYVAKEINNLVELVRSHTLVEQVEEQVGTIEI